ncbi:hypothetical protein [Winogradskya humida]|uniref:Uncharacterized protein n=1 Tax=Winogradskya humida TaxID=113566 RepID=A0ABQ3ZJ22_9ACTN|nr:hypothetical protein [Actinoplanes humidus]GIE18538.1 hypothetical protein Ahu01nite_016400 [Actinoplanes humidus]
MPRLVGVHMIAEVGSRVDPGVSLAEGARLTMATGEPVRLMLSLSRPHALEVDAVTAKPTLFAWVDADDVGVLVYRLGPIMPWAQVTYQPHRADEEAAVDGRNVEIMLVDRDSRVVRALHRVRWSYEFAAAVKASVTRMSEAPYNRIGHEHALAALRRRYPTPDDLVIDRADARCTAT